MRIGVFTYDFSHKKTYEGLCALAFMDADVQMTVAAPWKPLGLQESLIRTNVRGLEFPSAKEVAESIGSDFLVAPHESQDCYTAMVGLDLGIVLGARILPPGIVSAFNIGVLNLHPGILPENRGLDNIKWAVLNDWPQGMTAHLIGKRIDAGPIIKTERIRIFLDDSWSDIGLRLQNVETKLLKESVQFLAHHKSQKLGVPLKQRWGEYHSVMPAELERKTESLFPAYKKKWAW